MAKAEGQSDEGHQSDAGSAEAGLLATMISFSDRLGANANAANLWFDTMVERWRLRDGRRSPGMELIELGRQLVIWTINGELAIVADILSELERALYDPSLDSADAFSLASEVLDGLLIEVSEQRKAHAPPKRRRVPRYKQRDLSQIEQSVVDMMGDETKLLWIPMLSSIGPRASDV
jgi:hypothetical protein